MPIILCDAAKIWEARRTQRQDRRLGCRLEAAHPAVIALATDRAQEHSVAGLCPGRDGLAGKCLVRALELSS